MVTLESELRAHAVAARGFMPEDEGDALYEAAVLAARAVPGAPFVEVGSYCGRSTVWLGGAARLGNTTLFAVDHHLEVKKTNQDGNGTTNLLLTNAPAAWIRCHFFVQQFWMLGWQM